MDAIQIGIHDWHEGARLKCGASLPVLRTYYATLKTLTFFNTTLPQPRCTCVHGDCLATLHIMIIASFSNNVRQRNAMQQRHLDLKKLVTLETQQKCRLLGLHTPQPDSNMHIDNLTQILNDGHACNLGPPTPGHLSYACLMYSCHSQA